MSPVSAKYQLGELTKTLDILKKSCYNKSIKGEESQRSQKQKILKKIKKVLDKTKDL